MTDLKSIKRKVEQLNNSMAQEIVIKLLISLKKLMLVKFQVNFIIAIWQCIEIMKVLIIAGLIMTASSTAKLLTHMMIAKSDPSLVRR